jgi:uncharacterized protein YecT (DUF1311 family)
MVYCQTSKSTNVIDKRLEACLKDSTTTAGMCNCTLEAKNAWDRELNKYYKLLLSKLSEDGKIKLQEAQRQWILFRDKEAAFGSIYYFKEKQGTMFYIMAADKQMQTVKSRARELQTYYEVLTEY